MAKNPLVSICLPAYNGESFLPSAIESALSQTVTDFELIISDDASQDGSREIIETYARKDNRIVILRQESNQGLFANYNACLNKASGQYIKCFAQDDVLDRSMLEAGLKVLTSDPSINLVSTGRNWIDEKGNELKQVRPFSESRKISAREVIRYQLVALTNWIGEPSTVMFPRERAGNGFDTAFYHYGDLEMWFRVLGEGNYYYLDETLCSFRRHDTSATSRNHAGLFFAMDLFRLGRKYRSYLAEIGETEEQFFHRVTEVIALNIDFLVRTRDLTVAQTIQTGRDAAMRAVKEGKTDELLANLDSLREMNFHANRYITKILAELNDLQCRKDCEVADLQKQLTEIKESTSWKLTSRLRSLKRAIELWS